MSHDDLLSRPWLELIETVCRIDSRTADGCAGVNEVSTIFGQELERLGFALSWHDADPAEGPRGRHLIATRNPDAAVRLVLVGHSDTVLSTQDVPWRLDQAKQRIQGSGVFDMKGPDVLMIHAIADALHRSPAVERMGLVVLINAAEETSSASFRKLADAWTTGTAACLCFEPSRANEQGRPCFVSSRKGVVRFDLTCLGRASHAGTQHPHGVNALHEVARIALAVQALTDYDKGISANVGAIHGGHVSNQVCDEAILRFEVRAFDPGLLNDVCRRVHELCVPTLASPIDGHTTRITVKETRGFPAWQPAARHEALGRRYQAVAADHGLDVVPMASGGGSDASGFAPHMPTIDGIGIFGGGAHTREEWADLASYLPRMRSAADLIISLADRPTVD